MELLLIGIGIGAAASTTIIFLFFKYYLRKITNNLQKLASIDNDLALSDRVSDRETTDQQLDEIEEINNEIKQIRKQIITVRDPRMFNFLKEKIRYLENRKRGLLTGFKNFSNSSAAEISNLPVNPEELLKNVDNYSDEMLMQIAKPFLKYIPRPWRGFVNPTTVRLFIKSILPNLLQSSPTTQTTASKTGLEEKKRIKL